METVRVKSLSGFLADVSDRTHGSSFLWFRGEPDIPTALLPRLHRPRADGRPHVENTLLQEFRMKAGTFGDCPGREETDKWLFLAQHVGLPTRLLDWSESPLIGLHFALTAHTTGLRIVWMIDALELDRLSLPEKIRPSLINLVMLTWTEGHLGSVNVNAAWRWGEGAVQLPVAVPPTYVHPRMSVQRSCFTVHGSCRDSVLVQVPQLITRFEIEPTSVDLLRRELRRLGVDHSSVFPDLDGLTRELAELY